MLHTYIQTDRQTYRQTYRASDEVGPRGAFAPKNVSESLIFIREVFIVFRSPSFLTPKFSFFKTSGKLLFSF